MNALKWSLLIVLLLNMVVPSGFGASLSRRVSRLTTKSKKTNKDVSSLKRKVSKVEKRVAGVEVQQQKVKGIAKKFQSIEEKMTSVGVIQDKLQAKLMALEKRPAPKASSGQLLNKIDVKIKNKIDHEMTVLSKHIKLESSKHEESFAKLDTHFLILYIILGVLTVLVIITMYLALRRGKTVVRKKMIVKRSKQPVIENEVDTPQTPDETPDMPPMVTSDMADSEHKYRDDD
ncbi:MAG: hypothetical protein ISR65_07245 [Bacteriovoracaceae bacterium]|nr:hypothetical protein [Bacteriovoracaceae bacterium]